MSNIRKMLTAIVAPIQDLEDAIQTAITQRTIDDAVGAQLSQLGKLVRQRRQGIADDEVYRRYVRARIATNKSDGQGETIYNIARLVLGETDHELWFDNQGAAAYVLRVEAAPLDDELADVLIAFLRQATSAGVRAVLEYVTENPDTVGRWTSQGTWGTAVWATGQST